jgi:asparaginyl-tRNA synthetase
VRNNLAYATHLFFQQRGFQYIHTPIITASDCEGAGQMFQVTTLLPDPHAPVSKIPTIDGLPQVEEEKKDGKKKAKKDKKKAKKDGEAEPKKDGEEVKTDEQKVEQQVIE